MTADERLAQLIVFEIRGRRPMTASEIVRAIRRHAKVKTDARTVISIMGERRHFKRSLRRFFQRVARWELVEIGPADNPGTTGPPVPARPYPPILSGAAAADLSFREDEPPTNAISRPA